MLTQGFLTLAILAEQAGSYQPCSISRVTVSRDSSLSRAFQCILTIIEELSIAPHLNHQLVPGHIKPTLAANGLDIDNFQPLTKDQMIARLD